MKTRATIELDTVYGVVVRVPAVPGYVFANVRVRLVNGRPALVGFQLIADDEQSAPLTQEVFARIPGAEIARAAAPFFDLGSGRENEVISALGALNNGAIPLPEYTRGGSPEWHAAILAIARDAQARGHSAITAIMRRTNVGKDRAKQYSAAARRWEREQAASAQAVEPTETTAPPSQPHRPGAAVDRDRDRRTGRSRGKGSIHSAEIPEHERAAAFAAWVEEHKVTDSEGEK